ncbi:uncharacterized protein FA14DRAFT_162220 [Meira miltonrushii]|uniref:CAP-Gly domain-containing protein n=1 Tax=Meira miltonrushii TaxID=1280837 RepID=A0A316V6F7_9BASI|nr:uncharacterized protein FA14DRAFT_162220 [Meira miltonrushii]PWN33096.1 hypothetical protein FA14DRAFT_162220 [Meira miltonrushii]
MTTPRKSGLPVFAASGDTSVDGSNTALPKMIARKSLVGLRQASINEAESSTTPKRSSIQKNIIEPTPTTQKMKRKLEIGDEVVAEVNGTRYFGVLRHLGPVSFRAGEFAGLELIGGSEGKGKNDGSVDGRQYFACEPNNGMFCPAAKVKVVSYAPVTEATARPQSAMSSRSGRSSVTDDANRPPSVTPGRPRSSMAYSALPKPAVTPGRPMSRTSMGRPGSSLSQTPTAKVPLPRMLPRKSYADGLADEEGRRRAKTSAEEAAKAEGRITEGSRAHQFLNMSAKDLEARRLRGAATPTTNMNGGSPLKETLLGAHKTAPITPKIRTSIGSSLPTASLAHATPKATAKGRSSLFGHANKATIANGKMAPPSAASPGSPVQRIPNALAPPSASTNSSSTIPRTPRRLSSASGGTSTAVDEGADQDGAKERNRSLLEAMALLTPAQKAKDISPSLEEIPALPRDTDYDPDNVFAGAGLALMPDDGEMVNGSSSVDTAMGHAVIPLSLYEESNMEITHLKTELAQLRSSMQEAEEKAKNAQDIELERAKIKAREEERKEAEEERRVEKEDERRRRKAELDTKEKEWKEKADGIQKELRKLQDEHMRVREEHEKTKTDYESRLKDNETLVEKLKSTAGDPNAKSNESSGQIQAKDLELSQLNERLQRLESLREQEKADLLKEIDELKDAGQEALDLYDREQAISNEQIIDLESKMHLLEAKAQEAIADALRERDEALQGMTNGGLSSVAEIGQRSLEEQLTQAQSRAMKLEDQLSEANTIMQQEREEHIKRKDRYAEYEQKFKNDKAKLKLHIKQLEEADSEKQLRIDKLVEALEESRSALESERSELEALRAEAMIMGEGPDGKEVKALENGRFEAEIERLNGLLEGARSGKREAIRQVEEQRKEIADLHTLLDDARSHLESERQGTHKSSANLGVPANNRASMDSQHGSPYMASPIPESESVSPMMNGQGASYSPSMHASKRFSTASTQSRRSYGSGMGGNSMSSSEAMAKEMSGLRSIVNTLNQELTEVKVTSKQQERELRAQIEHLKNESRRFELLAADQGAKSVDSQSSASVEERLELETKLRNAEEEIVQLKKKVQVIENAKQEEIEKLNKDIAELEALCEATVWRREEQEARREELERKVGKLQRQLDRLQQGGSLDTASLDDDQSKSKEVVKNGEKEPSRHTESMSNGNSKSSSAPSQHSRESSEKHTTETPEIPTAQKQAPQPPNQPAPPAPAPKANATSTTCAECNEAGHAMDDCPYLNDDVLF